MPYMIGMPYRYITGLNKHGNPVYEDTAIAAITGDRLVLANGAWIDICTTHDTKLRPDLLPRSKPAA